MAAMLIRRTATSMAENPIRPFLIRIKELPQIRQRKKKISQSLMEMDWCVVKAEAEAEAKVEVKASDFAKVRRTAKVRRRRRLRLRLSPSLSYGDRRRHKLRRRKV
jgi:hypothetical protein